jgi:protein-L-isoaspartate(D-aspartate) O-methyltransferase
LEIGTGSGYQTAILCELVDVSERPMGATVWSVERYLTLAQRAAEVLQRLGYAPHLRVGDGAAGWPEAAPYDAVIVTAAARALPRPLWEQLRTGGRMVIPIGSAPDNQELWLLVRGEGRLLRRPLGPVRFVPLISPILDDPAQCINLSRRRDEAQDQAKE